MEKKHATFACKTKLDRKFYNIKTYQSLPKCSFGKAGRLIVVGGTTIIGDNSGASCWLLAPNRNGISYCATNITSGVTMQTFLNYSY